MTDNSRYKEFILNHPIMAITSGGVKLAECVQPMINAAIEQHLTALAYTRFIRLAPYDLTITVSTPGVFYTRESWIAEISRFAEMSNE